MNVIVSNKQKQIIDNANIDAIKDLNGLFNVDDLISKFKNYFFNKMILDATSIVNFTSDVTLEKLAHEIGSERLYILLPENPEPPKSFTDKLIELRIYNLSRFLNYYSYCCSYYNNNYCHYCCYYYYCFLKSLIPQLQSIYSLQSLVLYCHSSDALRDLDSNIRLRKS